MSVCPGCGVTRPDSGLVYDRKFHASAECWALFERVLAAEYQSPALFGRAHQLTVDAYAVQHAGGRHPDKSVDVHLVGLFLVHDAGIAPTDVPPRLQRLASRVSAWPHFAIPSHRSSLTVGDVAAAAGNAEEHVRLARAWAAEVWGCWAAHHDAIRAFARGVSEGEA